jgi:Alr-MurF fusion protein
MDPFDLRLWPGFAAAGGDLTFPAMTDQITIDSRRIDSPHALFVPLPGKEFDGHKFISHAAKVGARYALVAKEWNSPDFLENVTLLRVSDPLKAFQEIATSYRKQLSCSIIGISGSYGKTMVKDLLEAMIATTRLVVASPESFNSQIGVPLSLLTIKKEHEIALIEAGISKKDEMDSLGAMIAPDYAILTHIGKKHIATLGDIKTIAAETSKLLSLPPKKRWIIVPKDPLLTPYLNDLSTECHFWTEADPQLPHAYFVTDEHGAKMPYCVTFPDQTQHQGQITSGFYYFLDLINITVKAAWLLGISSEAISATLKNYILEPMRTEIWKSPSGATFINDTYCSDPQSVDQALNYFQQFAPTCRKVFVFGGMRGKRQHSEIDYRRIGKAINRSRIDLLILMGKHLFSPLIEEVNTHFPHTEISVCPNYQEALNQMRARIKQNDVVLIKGEKKESLDSLTEAFHDSICNNQCFINLAAIGANLATIRNKLPKESRIMVMVKALAYGTDEIRMAKFLETCGIDILGVSYVDEGVALKRAAINQAIFVINAAIYESAKVVKWELEIGVSEKALIEAIASEASRQNKKIKMHLHVDTGMSRFGCRPEEALSLARLILDCPSLQLEGIMTHFACADNPADDAFTLAQAHCFVKLLQDLKNHGIVPRWSHAANSSCVMRFDFPQFNMVRIGLAVYGLYSSEATKQAMELRLALSLISRIVGINVCNYGDTISYGRSYRVQKDRQRIAVLPIGYFDGLHRNYSGKSVVIIRGQRAPMVGKICMDFMMVDITDIPNAAIGDSVLIFGEDEYGHYLSPEDLASRGDSIIHELITCLGPRIQRIFVHEESRFTMDSKYRS